MFKNYCTSIFDSFMYGFIIWFAILCSMSVFTLSGCNPFSRGDKYASVDFQQVEQYYELINLIVKDPDVLVLFDSDQIEHLKKIDETFLSAMKIAKESPEMSEDTEMLQVMFDCGEAVCGLVIENERIPEKTKSRIRALLVGIKAFRIVLVVQDSIPNMEKIE